MRLTEQKLSVLEAKFGQPSTYLRAMIEGGGLYRGATMLASLDTETLRLDEFKDAMVDEDGEPHIKFVNLAKAGELPPRTPPVLYAVPADFGYVPLVGENGIAYSEDEDDHYPVTVKDADKKAIDVLGRTEGENWEISIDPEYLLLPVFALTHAGLVTQSVYNQFFVPRSVDKEGVFMIGTVLHNLKLTVNDLIDYLLCPNEDLDGNRLYKTLLKKGIDLQGQDVMTFLASGQLVPSKVAPTDVKVPQVEEKAEPSWSNMKPSELKKLYAKVCAEKEVPDDEKETSVERIKEHLTALEVE